MKGDSMDFRIASSDKLLKKIKFLLKNKDHPNLQILEDVKRDGENEDFFITTELLLPLNEYLRDNTADNSFIVRLCCDICDALDLYSKNGFYNGNVCPQNIFITLEGNFKLGEFETGSEKYYPGEKNIIADTSALTAITKELTKNEKLLKILSKNFQTPSELKNAILNG